VQLHWLFGMVFSMSAVWYFSFCTGVLIQIRAFSYSCMFKKDCQKQQISKDSLSYKIVGNS
jgi:hypothetical protein